MTASIKEAEYWKNAKNPQDSRFHADILRKKEMNKCFFCGEERLKAVTLLIKEKGKIRKESCCYICFNQARHCEGGLDFKGKILRLTG